ncbi:DUF2752 domain-containing protein [Sphingobacterium lactis]|uniref:DUF2752 domain-containing protein n=1 Tax=Sphingobacterium lactis TaxID=797291 RepID=UPI003DA5B28C
MRQEKNKLYLTTVIVCFFGLLWLALDYYSDAHIVVCPVKVVTGYPCPSCGSTRSITALLQGDWKGAILINPLGVLSALLIIAILALILYDGLAKKRVYEKVYRRTELFLQRHTLISSVLVVLILLNWIWNIKKGL